jgi:hypothetical protein
MRRGDQLAEAIAGERGYFGERLAVDQSRRQLAGDGYRDLDGFAFEPRFDRCECVGRFGEAGRDALERAGDPAAGLDRGVALRLRVAAALCGGFGLGECGRVLGKRDGRLAFAAGGEIDVEQEFCRGAHQ